MSDCDPDDIQRELLGYCEEYINGYSSRNLMKEITSCNVDVFYQVSFPLAHETRPQWQLQHWICLQLALQFGVLKQNGDILYLITALRIHLTSSNVDSRASATKLLSEVLEEFSSRLSGEDVHHVIEFLCDRLKDQLIVIPHVLSGLLIMVLGRTDLSDNDVIVIARTVVKEIHNQSLQCEDRNKVYAIFLTFFTDHREVLVKHSEEIVMGYIQIIDGEREPRNLVLVFSSVFIILEYFRIDPLTEDLFDIVSCYFPIDYSSPPGDESSAVTKDALVRGLRQCLSASPKFAEMCLPLLLEKLSSDVLSAKLESLHTMVSAIPVYGSAVLTSYLEPLWVAVKTEMFKTVSRELQLGCVAVVKSMAATLSQLQCSDQLGGFIKMALQDCQRHLSEPELKLMEPVVQLLGGIAMASDPAASGVLSAVVPTLLHQFNSAQQIVHKKAVLEALHTFLKASSSSTAIKVEVVSPVAGYKASLLTVLKSALHHNELKIKMLAVGLFSQLVEELVLETDEVCEYCQLLITMASVTRDSKLRDCLYRSLSSVCLAYPSLAKTHFIPPVLAELPGSLNNVQILPYLCPLSSLAESVLPVLLHLQQKLVTVHKFQSCEEMWTQVTPISCAGVRIVEQTKDSTLLGSDLILSILSTAIQVSNAHAVCCTQQISQWVELIANIFSCARHADNRWCEKCVQSILDVVAVPSSILPYTPAFFCIPFLTALLVSAPSAVVSQYSDRVSKVLMDVASMNLECSSTVHAAIGYASLINKCDEGQWLEDMVDKDMHHLWECLTSPAADEERNISDGQYGALRLWIWVTKALLMRGHPQGLPAALKLLGLCTSPTTTGEKAADGLRCILFDDQDCLNQHCHANIKLFYKQHLFLTILPHLLKLASTVSEQRKQHLLRALSHLLEGLPHQVVVGELPRVLPLLLESLTSQDVNVKKSSLKALHCIVQDTPDLLSAHVSTILPQLLHLTSDPTSMMVRRQALDCVGALSSLPPHTVFPHQQHVVRALANCVDDRKRLVRKAAVEARALWYLL